MATNCLPLSSLLFFDFLDSNSSRQNNFPIDIEAIKQLVIFLKNKYDVKTFIIDDIDKITASAMGRQALYTKDPAAIYHWKIRRSEYLLALLYFFSHKYNVDFILGKQKVKDSKPIITIDDIEYLDFGNNYDMIDAIIDKRNSKKLK